MSGFFWWITPVAELGDPVTGLMGRGNDNLHLTSIPCPDGEWFSETVNAEVASTYLHNVSSLNRKRRVAREHNEEGSQYKDLLVEKPITENAASAKKMVEVRERPSSSG